MKINKHAVLSAISIAGVIGTTAVTSYMAPKAYEAIKEKAGELKTYSESSKKIDASYTLSKKLTTADRIELVKTAAPYYIPTAALCFLTIGSIMLNNKEYKKELAVMSATAGYLAVNRDKFKRIANRISPTIPPAKEEFKSQTIEETGFGDLLCIEAYSGRIFRSSQEACISAQEKLCNQYLNDLYCSMDDYYYYLNILQSQFGYDHGWANNEDWYYKNEPIQFNNNLIAADAPGNEFGEPVFFMQIEEDWYPMECWMEV